MLFEYGEVATWSHKNLVMSNIVHRQKELTAFDLVTYEPFLLKIYVCLDVYSLFPFNNPLYWWVLFYLQKLIYKKLQAEEESVYLVQGWCSWRRRSDVRLVVVWVEELVLLLPVLEKKEIEWWRLSVCWSCCCCRYVERRRSVVALMEESVVETAEREGKKNGRKTGGRLVCFNFCTPFFSPPDHKIHFYL